MEPDYGFGGEVPIWHIQGVEDIGSEQLHKLLQAAVKRGWLRDGHIEGWTYLVGPQAKEIISSNEGGFSGAESICYQEKTAMRKPRLTKTEVAILDCLYSGHTIQHETGREIQQGYEVLVAATQKNWDYIRERTRFLLRADLVTRTSVSYLRSPFCEGGPLRKGHWTLFAIMPLGIQALKDAGELRTCLACEDEAGNEVQA